MQQKLHDKLDTLVARYQELTALLGSADIIENQPYFRQLAKEYALLEPLIDCFNRYQATQDALDQALPLLHDADSAICQMAQAEIKHHKAHMMSLEDQLKMLLLPNDLQEKNSLFLEIRAAAGGDEAAIFAGDLMHMYTKYAEKMHWQYEIIHRSLGEQGGYKEMIMRVFGHHAYAHLKFESGAHRVQRVPATETQGRVHTSTCTVAVLPEVDDIEEIKLNPADLRIDTYRASGAGGQHVNKTDSAIRITHLPTGVVVECQDERSQHKNRARAMSLLQSRLLASEQAKQRSQQTVTRRNLVGTGDRSERIRTYNYPQGRVSDHRINLTLYQLPDIMAGHLDTIISTLIREHQADQLAAIGKE